MGTDEMMKDALADMFALLSQKVRRGNLTCDDMRAILSSLEAGGGIKATISDLATFYGKTEAGVRNVIHRSYIPRPERRVYYDFQKFRKIVPRRWAQTLHNQPQK